MLNGLDLFSGIGGITLALSEWVRPVAYCEIDRYAQGVLLSRMADGSLPEAPIWDDITTLKGSMLPVRPDIIYGGFPCQDISIAGCGAGLAGKRSGLFFEITRLVGEIRPRFVFLENVAEIINRGGVRVITEFTAMGYDVRYGILSAEDVGAPHSRERWFILAHPASNRLEGELRQDLLCANGTSKALPPRSSGSMGDVFKDWEEFYAKSDLVGKDDGIRYRVDRIKCLGNAVVPSQAREAFKRLMGIKQ